MSDGIDERDVLPLLKGTSSVKTADHPELVTFVDGPLHGTTMAIYVPLEPTSFPLGRAGTYDPMRVYKPMPPASGHPTRTRMVWVPPASAAASIDLDGLQSAGDVLATGTQVWDAEAYRFLGRQIIAAVARIRELEAQHANGSLHRRFA